MESVLCVNIHGFLFLKILSKVYASCQKKIQDVAAHAYYVYCASQNLNWALKDAMEAVA